MSIPRFQFGSLALAAAALLGCAAPAPQATLAPFVKPVQSVRHGGDADANYVTGRYFQGQSRYAEAIAAFERALQVNPRHADSLNALGVIYSVQQRGELAEAMFRAAIEAAPDSVLAHNNFGYHLLANGRTQEAMEQFRSAASLDPSNATVAANMAAAGSTSSAVPQVQVASQADAQALQPPAVEAAVVQVTQAVPAQATQAEPAQVSPAAAPAQVSVAQLSAVPTVPANVEVVPASAAPGAKIAGRIEVANGNGTTGLARGVSQVLAAQDTSGFRLTNAKPFGVQASTIQYVAGAQESAQRLNERLPVRLPLTQVASLERNATVRVLLGKDFPPATINRSSTRSSS